MKDARIRLIYLRLVAVTGASYDYDYEYDFRSKAASEHFRLL